MHPDPEREAAGPNAPRRRRWLVAAILAAAAVLALAVVVSTAVPLTSGRARRAVIEYLSAQLEGEVELRELDLRLFPSLRAEGQGLVIRHKGRRDVPPLITIGRFAAEGTVLGVFGRRLDRLTVDGLDIQIPPDKNRNAPGAPAPQDPKATSAATLPSDGAQESQPGARTGGSNAGLEIARTFIIGELVSENARLAIHRRQPGKEPRVWQIHTLRMRELAIDRAMPFQAQLTNAVPPGEIDVEGRFGPWHRDEPAFTPLDGTFRFEKADLGVFKGISGILAAEGSFGGMIERIEVHGETETPEFTVSSSHLPVPLSTRYHAIVDGTNGDTFLERVDASFLGTSLVAKGAVAHTPEREKGRTINLDITMRRGRIEDVLRLAVESPKPPMTGALSLETSFLLPPGDADVVRKLRLDGRFDIGAARFTDPDVQRKINELSRRGRGRADEAPGADRVASDFSGAFRLGSGQLAIPEVVFDVPGAAVELNGTYGLESEVLNFEGWLYLDARISQTTTGFKSLLLKVVDPLFKRPGGGSAVPIRITGSRNDPSFGLDKGRILKKKG